MAEMTKLVATQHYPINTYIVLRLENIRQFSFDGTWDVIHILGFDGGLQGVLQDLGEIVLELAATKMNQNFLPIRRSVVSSQVGFHLTRQDFESCGLSNTVGPDQSQHLTRTGHGKSMQLERVGTISVSGVLLKIFWKINDIDGFKWALLDTNTATWKRRRCVVSYGSSGQVGAWFQPLK
jgi:hypothetical protein